MILKVRFILDSAGIEIRPTEPIHLDGLLAWAVESHSGREYIPERNAVPTETDLPLKKYFSGEEWCWKASAILPEGESVESIRFVRRKFDEQNAELTTGKPNLIGLRYKDSNMPHLHLLAKSLVAYADTPDPEKVKELLGRVKYLGPGASRGNGRLQGIEFEETDEDRTVIYNGVACRYVPHPNGWKLVRCRPEYWKYLGRTFCFVPGDIVR